MKRLALVLMMGWPMLAMGHAGHDSVMEAAFRKETNMLEVTVSVHAGDLEQALSLVNGRKVALDQKEGLDELILSYLKRTILIERSDVGRPDFSWVGCEKAGGSGHHADGELVLLHFEVSLPGGVEGIRLNQSAFCEMHEDQINLVHLRDGERKVTLGFSPGREAQVVKFAE